jgi:hypothetical protein
MAAKFKTSSLNSHGTYMLSASIGYFQAKPIVNLILSIGSAGIDSSVEVC